MTSRVDDLVDAAVSLRDVRDALLSGRLEALPSDIVDERCLLSATTWR